MHVFCLVINYLINKLIIPEIHIRYIYFSQNVSFKKLLDAKMSIMQVKNIEVVVCALYTCTGYTITYVSSENNVTAVDIMVLISMNKNSCDIYVHFSLNFVCNKSTRDFVR